MTTRSAALALSLLLIAGAARADNEERARAHFEAGRVQYNLGDYTAAVREFAAGYRLVPRPQFLVNLGQAYRRLGQLERAREMYERFIADAPPGDRARPQVRALIAEVERELERARAAAPSDPPAARRAPEPDELGPDPFEAEPRPRPALTAAPPQADHPPGFWRRNWWIIPVGVVALAGLSVGIYFAARPSGPAGPDCSAATLGCLNLRN